MTRVLVVEDEPGILRYMLRVLQDAGYEAIGAGRVGEALAMLGPFAALVVDIGLPNGEPRDVQRAHPGVPTITVSGDHNKHPDLRKPFRSADLVHAVQALIGGST